MNILQHLPAILALAALLAGWVAFQQWLQRRGELDTKYKPGCGACSNKDSCGTSNSDESKQVKL
ncbi:MAG: hypothetical protein HOM84_02760 [Thiotrichales bacterium]|nr:hypothetical protein [Thiotrichales bacterium]MBT3613919.1 hypothetical protein [Thiotrichales bacterium]MBT3752217.1 hypothetical protein [Thiotrichales bacterium]MBT3836859.1 hypothetical protein [Thiotrichales bacterium]MBT4151787.1 hypothetical protein [Thiotrichales bacterium]